MSCLFLKGAHYKMCMAYDDIMILSLEELKNYCETQHYDLCPIYGRFQTEGIKTPVDQHKSYKVFVKS